MKFRGFLVTVVLLVCAGVCVADQQWLAQEDKKNTTSLAQPEGTPKLYLPNDPNLYYSPFAWDVNGHAASTINSASYLKFMFSGSMLNFKFDVSAMVTPTSEVYWAVDQGPKTLSLVSGQ